MDARVNFEAKLGKLLFGAILLVMTSAASAIRHGWRSAACSTP
jgi:hypothetical protein